MRSQHTRQQAHRRAGILRVERRGGRPQPAKAAAGDADGEAAFR
jgi:hypothetical protein